MQVLFPNPFGQPAASAQEVAALQAHIGFSDAYAQFLITQNGFSMYALEQASDHASYLQHSTAIASESHANFADLFSFGAQQHQEDLKTVQSEFLLARWFVAIGHDQGGNPFVEVLHGRHKERSAVWTTTFFWAPAICRSSSAIWSWSILRHSASQIRPTHCATPRWA